MICKACGKDFELTRKDRKYCSLLCRTSMSRSKSFKDGKCVELFRYSKKEVNRFIKVCKYNHIEIASNGFLREQMSENSSVPPISGVKKID